MLGAGLSAQVSKPVKTTGSVSVGYVMVPFVLTDLKGKPVPDLKEKDVTLLVDGQAVKTDLFSRSDDAPVSFTLLIDASGSMGLVGKMDGARAAVRALVSQKLPGDDFALYAFSSGDVREIVPFTSDTARLVAAVDAIQPHGRTAFYDALARMPDRTLLGRNGSRAIVLMTDGMDNASELTREDLAVLLEGVDVPVYPIGLRSPGAPITPPPGVTAEAMLNLDILAHVARLSGGLLSIVDGADQLPGAIARIEKDLRTQYLLGFTPTGEGPVRYRRISLKLSGPARPVRVRAGYRGTPPPLKGG
jgi:Ca-activated chloride channel family protein